MTLASTAAVAAASFLLCCTCCSLQLLKLSQQLLLQPLSQSFFIPATLLLQDKPHMESPLALQIHQQIIVASLKSVIWTRVGTTIINSDLECQGVIQLNIRLTFSATSHLSTVYQNMYFGISNWQFCILNEAAILEMWFLLPSLVPYHGPVEFSKKTDTKSDRREGGMAFWYKLGMRSRQRTNRT